MIPLPLPHLDHISFHYESLFFFKGCAQNMQVLSLSCLTRLLLGPTMWGLPFSRGRAFQPSCEVLEEPFRALAGRARNATVAFVPF